MASGKLKMLMREKKNEKPAIHSLHNSTSAFTAQVISPHQQKIVKQKFSHHLIIGRCGGGGGGVNRRRPKVDSNFNHCGLEQTATIKTPKRRDAQMRHKIEHRALPV